VGLLVGAVPCVPTGFTIVAALRGQPLLGGFDPGRRWRSVVVNGAWRWGAGLLRPGARRLRLA
jgi:hypothetical protein